MQAALSRLEMPRFTRRYPKLADAVLRQMLAVTRAFEAELLKKQAEAEKRRDPLQQQRRQQQQGDNAEDDSNEDDQQDGTGGGEEQADGEASGEAQQQEGGQPQDLQVRMVVTIELTLFGFRPGPTRVPYCGAQSCV